MHPLRSDKMEKRPCAPEGWEKAVKAARIGEVPPWEKNSTTRSGKQGLYLQNFDEDFSNVEFGMRILRTVRVSSL